MPETINDLLLRETAKAAPAGASTHNLPFPSAGYGGSIVGYSTMQAWDAVLDQTYGGGEQQRVVADYLQKIGDLSQSSLICAAVRFLSNVLPESPLQVKENEEGKKGESEVVGDHELTKLWKHPNRYYTGRTLLKGIAFSWVLRAEAYLLKFYNNAGTSPLELWYEPPWSIRPAWPINGSEFISHYEVNRGGQWYPVPVESVIHIRDGFSPYNQRLGFDTNITLAREFFGDGEAASYYASLMGGSGVPPFVASVDKDVAMQQGDVERLTASLTRRTTGPNRGKPLVAKGVRVFKLGFTPREMDLRETRYMAEERFCAVRGIPDVVLELGSSKQSSIYNNVKQAMERAYYSCVIPLLAQIEDELSIQLLTDYEETDEQGHITNGRYLAHDLSKVSALQEDQDALATRITTLYEKGVIKRKEARSAMNYGPSDEQNPDADDIFFGGKGASLLQPDEQPTQLTGTQSTVTNIGGEGEGKVEPKPTAGKKPAVPPSVTKRIELARSRRTARLLAAQAEAGNGNGKHGRLEL